MFLICDLWDHPGHYPTGDDDDAAEEMGNTNTYHEYLGIGDERFCLVRNIYEETVRECC